MEEFHYNGFHLDHEQMTPSRYIFLLFGTFSFSAVISYNAVQLSLSHVSAFDIPSAF